jgi:mono/diheme cytochrome c family protein
MKTLITIAVTLVSIAVLLLLYVFSGLFNPSALSPHNSFTKWVINTTEDNSIERRVKKIKMPDLADSSMFKEGFGHYNEMCVICHSAPGINESEISKGLYPQAPILYQYSSQMDPKETFWIIKNGLKMTGMPAFGPTHTDHNIWAITTFIIQKLQTLNSEQYKTWQQKYSEEEIEDND